MKKGTKSIFLVLECDDDRQCTSSSTDVAFKCENRICVLGKTQFSDKKYPIRLWN